MYGRRLPSDFGRVVFALSREGVMRMQYVTYENLFGFSLVLIGIVGLVLEAVHTHKKK